MKLHSHQLQFGVRSLGPGRRVAYWVSGCSIGCPQCCSTETHDRSAGVILEVDQIVGAIIGHAAAGEKVDGLTISGGESTEQSVAVLALIGAFKAAFPDADVLLYSGQPWRVIEREFGDLVAACDVIIAEPFVHKLSGPTQRPVLAGSANQTVKMLTERGRERFAAYLTRPPTIQLHKLAYDAAAPADGQNPQIRFTGVPNATFLKPSHD